MNDHQTDRGHRTHGSDPGFLFSPYEIAITGLSGSGKTMLAEGLLHYFSLVHPGRFAVGYAKHSSHEFQMDADGKDTDRATRAGARITHIRNERHSATLSTDSRDLPRLPWLECDFVIAEGFRHSALPKIVIVDEQAEILREAEEGSVRNVIAYVVDPRHEAIRSRTEKLAGDIPIFESGAVEKIAEHLLGLFAAQAAALPLYGLVLAGGKSSRMQRDKASIEYHGEPQVLYAYHLLERTCEKVFVSVRSAESESFGLPTLADRFVDFGPMGGILTALHEHPHAAWVVLGCDLPFVTADTVATLLSLRDPFKVASVFDSSSDGLPEPLCAVYEPVYRHRLHQFLGGGISCPRKALINSHVNHLSLPDPEALANVNTPEEYRTAIDRIRGTGKEHAHGR